MQQIQAQVCYSGHTGNSRHTSTLGTADTQAHWKLLGTLGTAVTLDVQLMAFKYPAYIHT